MKRLTLLAILLLCSCPAFALDAVAYNKWVNDAGDTIKVMGNDSIPCTFWNGSEWQTISTDWKRVSDTLFAVVANREQIWVSTKGVVRYKLDEHVLSLTLGDLIKVNMVDTAAKELDFDGIDSVLESPSIDSITISGHVLTFWGVYSGVNIAVSSGNSWYQFVYYFTQSARDKLAKAGALSDGDIATVIVINTDSLNLTFKDDEGDWDIDELGTVVDGKTILDARVVDGVMTLEESDVPIFGMPPEYLRHDSLGTTDIEVQKIIVVKDNKQLLIEKFCAAATAKLPDGDLQHNATLGSYFTTGGSSVDLENVMIGSQSFTASANGTLDSVRIYMVNVTGSSKNLKAALYNYVTTSDSSLVDVTNQQAVSASGTVKIDFPDPAGSVVSGQTYLIAVWASAATGFCEGYHRSGTSYNERYSSATYGTYPDPYTYSSTRAGYEMSVQVYYTTTATISRRNRILRQTIGEYNFFQYRPSPAWLWAGDNS